MVRNKGSTSAVRMFEKGINGKSGVVAKTVASGAVA
jgi:hypothetical protein